jgi:Protein of unknown function (DUF2917)
VDSGLFQEALVHLPRCRTLRLRDAQKRRISVVKGVVWITQEGDSRDVFLKKGETFMFDRPGLALTQAVGQDATLILDDGLDATTPCNEASTMSAAAKSVKACVPTRAR